MEVDHAVATYLCVLMLVLILACVFGQLRLKRKAKQEAQGK